MEFSFSFHTSYPNCMQVFRLFLISPNTDMLCLILKIANARKATFHYTYFGFSLLTRQWKLSCRSCCILWLKKDSAEVEGSGNGASGCELLMQLGAIDWLMSRPPGTFILPDWPHDPISLLLPAATNNDIIQLLVCLLRRRWNWQVSSYIHLNL